MDELAVFMPTKTALEDIIEGVQVPADLPALTQGEHPFQLFTETFHIGKAAAAGGERLSR